MIAGVPAPGLLGFVVRLLAISQIGEPLIILVWGGAAWGLFRQDAEGWGAFMNVWGLVLATMSDDLVRPWVIKQGVAMPLTVVLLGVFGGFLAFGFLGLFIGPAILAVAFTQLRAWRAQASPAMSGASPCGPPLQRDGDTPTAPKTSPASLTGHLRGS